MRKALCSLVLLALLPLVACNGSAVILTGVDIAAVAAQTIINTNSSISPATKAAYTTAINTFVQSLSATATTCAGNGGAAMAQCLSSNLLPAFQAVINTAVKNPGEQATVQAYLGAVQVAINLIYQNYGQPAPAPLVPVPTTVAAMDAYSDAIGEAVLEADRRHVPERAIRAYVLESDAELGGR